MQVFNPPVAMSRWEDMMLAASHEMLAIALFRDLYGDPPNPKQWCLADSQTKRTFRNDAMKIMLKPIQERS